MPKVDESYTVTVTFTRVRGISDLLLRLIRVTAWFDHKNDLDAGLSHQVGRKQPMRLRHNGLLDYGTVKVVSDGE